MCLLRSQYYERSLQRVSRYFLTPQECVKGESLTKTATAQPTPPVQAEFGQLSSQAGACQVCQSAGTKVRVGASGRIRTDDLRFTNLSYQVPTGPSPSHPVPLCSLHNAVSYHHVHPVTPYPAPSVCKMFARIVIRGELLSRPCSISVMPRPT